MRFFQRKTPATHNPTPRLYGGEFRLDLTQEEILQDLFWPGPPPGRWPLDEPATAEVRRLDPLPHRARAA